jgi:hypothetical protein
MPISDTDFVTPVDVLAAVSSFFGGQINLDPASSHNANRLVQAEKYFCPENQGLRQLWKADSVYLYPPRDRLLGIEQPPDRSLWTKKKRFAKSAQRVWMEEMLRKYTLGEFKQGILFITSTDVALLAAQKIGLDLPLCILKDHPKLRHDDREFTRVNTNKIYGFLFYFPPMENTEKRILEYNELFNTLGRVYI